MKDVFAEIIEKSLFEMSSSPSEDIAEKIIEEYLAHLKDHQIHIPIKFKNSIIEDFKEEIRKKVF